MIAGVITMVINVFLNWVLIFGNLGAPALGVNGAAIASVVASWTGFLVIALFFGTAFGIPDGGKARPKDLRTSELWRMLRFGIPHGLNWFFEFAAFVVFINVVVAKLGTTVLAAMMVVFNINSVSFMPAFGLTSAGAILCGQAIGSRQLDQVSRVFVRTLSVALIWQGSVGLIYLLAPSFLMRWFATSQADTTQLVRIGAVLLALSAAWQLFDAVAMTVGEILRSAGDTAWVLWARLVIAWFLFTPAAFLTVRWMGGGHVAAMLCVIGYLGLLAVVLAWRYRTGAWKKIDLTGAQPELATP